MEQEEFLVLVNSLKIISDDLDGGVVILDGKSMEHGEKKLHAYLACKVLSTTAMPRDVFRAQVPKILLDHKLDPLGEPKPKPN